jgi:tellurite resistance protein TehA-like permease
MDAIRDLHPGYFAFVMATGIISTGTFPLGMYSVATLTFGQAAGISFMAPLARVMIWVAVAAWILVAAAFLSQRARLSRRQADGRRDRRGPGFSPQPGSRTGRGRPRA